MIHEIEFWVTVSGAALFFAASIRNIFLIRTIVRLVQNASPALAETLTTYENPVLDYLSWVNIFTFSAFVKSYKPIGDPNLDLSVQRFRKNRIVALTAWSLMMAGIVLLGVEVLIEWHRLRP